MSRLFAPTIRARFVERPNRFIVHCLLDGQDERVVAYLPNPGRLRELFLPGVTLDLVENAGAHDSSRKTAYTVVAVRRPPGRPIMLHTHQTNTVARLLLEQRRVPGLEDATVVKAEHTVGRSRFDFLLERGGAPLLLEVKSCTLVGERVAMFPDAITARGARHVAELAELSREGTATAVLFVIHWPEARIFSPDYHTDLEFARTLLVAREDVQIIALAIGWKDDLTLDETARPCTIPWEVIDHEAEDRGSYLVVLDLPEDQTIATGALGEVPYRAGHYVYVGSAMANLTKRLARHRRLRKKHHWHIDHLRAEASFVAGLPIRASARLECDLAAEVRALADWEIACFGATDCGCGGHLFGFDGDPQSRPSFQRFLMRWRLDRLEELVGAVNK